MRKLAVKNRRGASVPKAKTDDYPAYPTYSDEEDIETEQIAELKNPKRKVAVTRKKSVLRYHEDDVSDEYLDIPGSELDDDQEDIGSEDEENNYYSIGGDDHNNLEEDQYN